MAKRKPMFRIEISSLHEFRVFVKILRGQDITEEEIQKLTIQLNASADELNKANQSQKET